MVESFFAFLTYLEAIINPGNTAGLLALFFLAVITDIGVPVPFVLDTILILTSYKSGPFSIQVVLIVIMLFLGRQVGSAILYLLSRFLGGGFLNWLAKSFPSLSNRLNLRKTSLNRWAPVAVVTGRLTPGLLQVTSVAAGAVRLRYYYFALGIAGASIIYDGVLVLLGFAASHSPKSGDINFTMWTIIAILIIVILLWPISYLLLQRSGKKAANRPEHQ